MRSNQCPQPRAVDILDVVHIQDDFLLSFGDQALQFLTQSIALLAEHDAAFQLRTRRPLRGPPSSMPCLFPPHPSFTSLQSSRVFVGNSKLLAQFPDADVQLVHRTAEHRCEVTAWLGSCLCHGAPAF